MIFVTANTFASYTNYRMNAGILFFIFKVYWKKRQTQFDVYY